MAKVGRHISTAGSISFSVERAMELGCNTMQVFVTNPRGWAVSAGGKAADSEFSDLAEQSGLVPMCAHMPYLPNLASPDPDIHRKSITSLKENLARCNDLGIRYLVTHLGSDKGAGHGLGIDSVIDALDRVAGDAADVIILLENQAGHRNSIGADLSDLEMIYSRTRLAESGNLGFCLDTCHLFEAGYDIRKKDAIVKMFERVDLQKVHAFHVNDAKFGFGERHDRHDNIGMGSVGVGGFRTLLGYKDVNRKLLILETPECTGITWKDEISLIRSLAERD